MRVGGRLAHCAWRWGCSRLMLGSECDWELRGRETVEGRQWVIERKTPFYRLLESHLTSAHSGACKCFQRGDKDERESVSYFNAFIIFTMLTLWILDRSNCLETSWRLLVYTVFLLCIQSWAEMNLKSERWQQRNGTWEVLEREDVNKV